MYTNQQFSETFQQLQASSNTYTAADVRTAREHLIKAAETTLQLEAEVKKPVWRSKQTHDDLRTQLQTAKAEEQAANEHFTEVFRQAGWLEAQEKKQQREAEQERQRKEDQAKRAATIEQEVRREYHDLWLVNGGTSQSFESAWPSMWQKELEKRTVAGQNELVASMRKSGQYELL